MFWPFDAAEFALRLLAVAEEGAPVGENKPTSESRQACAPSQSSPRYSGRLQLLYLPDDTFVVVFDRWQGPRLDTVGIDMVKKTLGARGVLFFEGEIEIA